MFKDEYQIGILGGSFDPVHLGHLGLAQEIYKKFDLDQVLIKIDTGRRLKKLVRRSESVYSF